MLQWSDLEVSSIFETDHSLYEWSNLIHSIGGLRALLANLSQGLLAGNTKVESITVLLTSSLTGLESAVWQLTNFVFYLQNRLAQTSKTGGQRYSDASPFSIPCLQGIETPAQVAGGQWYSGTSPFSIPCLQALTNACE